MKILTFMRKNSRRSITSLGLFLIALTSFSLTNAMADDANPYSMADRSWITISGKVKSISPNTFVLNYDKGAIVVEMDDGDRDADAYDLLPGDEVTVSGRIDDDFFETTTIEAFSVYVKNIDTTFFADAADEEGPDRYSVTVFAPLGDYQYNLVGKVTEVNDDEFILDTGLRSLNVEVDGMTSNPLDDEGYQKIKKGDRVSVSGRFDYDLFEGRQVEADTIVKLSYSDS